jgi:hypothetical protein
MAYYTGSAVSFAAVKTALVNACVADGWTNTADAGGNVVLSKSGVFVQVVEALVSLSFLGRTSLDAGNAPNPVSMGDITVLQDAYGVVSDIVSFPLTYHVFTFTNEVFLVIGYADRYQWATFGLSTQAGLPGTGAFVCATASTRSGYRGLVDIRAGRSAVPWMYSVTTPALFWPTTYVTAGHKNCFLHSNIDPSLPWTLPLTELEYDTTGIQHCTELIKTQPNTFNSESVLLPIRAYKERIESKISQVMEMENARHIRVDNYNNEHILTLGLDQWMIFPWYKKNVADRDCTGATYQDHTGTFGWAIKYEGP